MAYTIKNNSTKNMSVVEKLIEEFYPYAQDKLRFDKPVNVFLESDLDNYKNPLGKTAYYDPENTSITLFVDGRHPKDIMRSFSHELTHHAQNCTGQFENAGPTHEGYAQTDPHLRKMEEDAYLRGNLVFRDWENSVNLKETKQMTMNETTLRSIIRGALNQILESKDEALLEKIKTELEEYKRTNVAGREQGRSSLDPDTHEKLREDDIEERKKKGTWKAGQVDDGEDEVPHIDDASAQKGPSTLHKEDVEDSIDEKKWSGAKKGDKGKDPRDPEARDYEHGGDRKDDKSKTHSGDDYVKGHKKKKSSCPSDEEDIAVVELAEEAVDEDKDWGGNKGDYKRAKDPEGVRKKRGDVGHHYKDYKQKWGGNKGDKSKSRPGDEDYEAHKGSKSKTHSGEDFEARKGTKSKTRKGHEDFEAHKGTKSKTHKGRDYEKNEEQDVELEESPGNKREPHARPGRGLTDPSGTKPRGTLAEDVTPTAMTDSEKAAKAQSIATANAPGNPDDCERNQYWDEGSKTCVDDTAQMAQSPAAQVQKEQAGNDNWYRGTLYERLLKEWVKK